MKTVIAIDSFKESVTSLQAAEAIRCGILNVCPDMETRIYLLADGGEGTVNAITYGCDGELVQCNVTSSIGNKINAEYGVIKKLGTAVIEIASAAGLASISHNKRNPLNATTYGVGEMISDALDKGYRKFIIGLGGSATNDGGLGMLQALGYRFFDGAGKQVGCLGRDVENVATVDITTRDKRLNECSFILAADVNNPLCGENGASFVFGPQKGANEETVIRLDVALKNYAEIVKNALGKDVSEQPGAGAAGGLGFAFMAFLNASMQSGVQTVIKMTDMENAIKEADFVVTGEGRLDLQTSMGKAPMGIAQIAKKYDKLVIAIAGCVGDGATECNRIGIDAYFPIIQAPISLENALDVGRTQKSITKTVEQIFNLISAVLPYRKTER